ncbi:MAG: sugar transferase [Chloroflexi bacterium]|nr:sugar transferase [Chloroflexota bacterium]
MLQEDISSPSLGTIDFDAWAHGPQALDLNQRLYYGFKRVLDVIGAFCALFVLAPVFAVIAVWIKLDSSGPVIYRQQRVGSRRVVKEGRVTWETHTFTFYKFRSMYQDTDCALHRAFVEAFIDGDETRMADLNGHNATVRKLTDDPRVTHVGRFLRRCSLDELPQFWNVLKGDMALVGPRPPLPYEVEKYKTWHHLRFHALPGLTGLWQVAARSSAEFDEMVQLDLWYIQHQSLWLDIKILLRTPLAVCRGQGAC